MEPEDKNIKDEVLYRCFYVFLIFGFIGYYHHIVTYNYIVSKGFDIFAFIVCGIFIGVLK